MKKVYWELLGCSLFLFILMPMLVPLLPAGREIHITLILIAFMLLRVLIKDNLQFLKVWGLVFAVSFVLG